jgi:hypothetical protein
MAAYGRSGRLLVLCDQVGIGALRGLLSTFCCLSWLPIRGWGDPREAGLGCPAVIAAGVLYGFGSGWRWAAAGPPIGPRPPLPLTLTTSVHSTYVGLHASSSFRYGRSQSFRAAPPRGCSTAAPRRAKSRDLPERFLRPILRRPRCRPLLRLRFPLLSLD